MINCSYLYGNRRSCSISLKRDTIRDFSLFFLATTTTLFLLSPIHQVVSVDVPSTVSIVPTFCGKPLKDFPSVIDGTEGNDKLVGTKNSDLIRGFGGNDRIYGYKGDDCLLGGTGNDIIYGYTGNDWLDGGLGSDRLYGQTNDDQLYGGPGNDFLDGGSGNDNLNGGSGTDTCFGGYGINPEVNCEVH